MKRVITLSESSLKFLRDHLCDQISGSSPIELLEDYTTLLNCLGCKEDQSEFLRGVEDSEDKFVIDASLSRLEAVKLVRQLTGHGLAESVDLVRKHGREIPITLIKKLNFWESVRNYGCYRGGVFYGGQFFESTGVFVSWLEQNNKV